ncbi:MAG: hypothetical protein E4H01_11105 [Lysobacterales bacterium]|nr:MAG: hypothetical protein E4H01_11105 [Xanthomonadales bacterium]
MTEVTVIFVLWMVFALTHVVLSSSPLRPQAVRLFGERLFQGLYSLAAFAVFAPLVLVYADNKHIGPLLWFIEPGLLTDIVTRIGNTIAVLLVVAGIFRPSPTGVTGTPTRRPSGVQRITRHPLFMGIVLWALMHLLVNGYASDVVFFGGFVIFGLLGSWHQDHRQKALPDGAYAKFCEQSPFLPFTGGNIIKGFREVGVLPIVVGLLTTGLLRYFHASLFG